MSLAGNVETPSVRLRLNPFAPKPPGKKRSKRSLPGNDFEINPPKRRSVRLSKGKYEDDKEEDTKPSDEKYQYMCVCEKLYSTKQKMIQHVRSIHGTDKFICTVCMDEQKKNFWFSNISSLKRHCKKAAHMSKIMDSISLAALDLVPSDEDDSDK